MVAALKCRDFVRFEVRRVPEMRVVTIDAADGVKINNAKVAKADIECGNGVIHVIDTVLLPKE